MDDFAKSNSETVELLGQSPAFEQMLESIRQVAPTQITVLITGESGTGKEIVARTIHQYSARKDKPIITVNCGAIPEGILESELFGHEKGAFTGASDARKGYFEMAHEGTVFLDEIGEMPIATQVKLLRVLESRSFMRVGGNKTIHADVRVLAATNRDLAEAVQRGDFRQDLFYRLNAVHIPVPPLRERREDIHELAVHFAKETCRINGIPYPGFTLPALEAMAEYSWPGNIRELRNIVERLVVMEHGEKITESMVEKYLMQPQSRESQHLPMVMHKTSDQAERELIYRALLDIRVALEDMKRLIVNYHERSIGPASWNPVPVDSETSQNRKKVDEIPMLTIQELEKQQIERALVQFHGNRRKIARTLGIGERTLYRKLKEYDLE